MKTKLIITVALISLAAVIGCSKAPEKQASAGAAARDTFLRRCAACHGIDGEGKAVGSLSTPSLKRAEALNYSDEQLFERSYMGTGNMPSFKNSLGEEEINSLVRYIREELQGREKPAS